MTAASGPTQCTRCDGRLEEGFAIDSFHYHLSRRHMWFKGPATANPFGPGGCESRAIELWRCTNCGFLEAYARQILNEAQPQAPEFRIGFGKPEDPF